MKPSGLLLAATVVGAVAIGGAVTGSTHATWRDSAALAPATIEAGFLDVELSATPTALPDLEPNESTVVTLVVDTSGAGKNLRAATTLRATTPVAESISYAVGVTPEGALCDTVELTPWTGGELQLIGGSLIPRPVLVCLEINRGDGNVAGNKVDVALEASAQQYRDGSEAGWSDTAQITLSGNAPEGPDDPGPSLPSTPTGLSCGVFSAKKTVTLSWAPSNGASWYRILDSQGRVRKDGISATSATISEVEAGGVLVELRVQAINAAGATTSTSRFKIQLASEMCEVIQ